MFKKWKCKLKKGFSSSSLHIFVHFWRFFKALWLYKCYQKWRKTLFNDGVSKKNHQKLPKVWRRGRRKPFSPYNSIISSIFRSFIKVFTYVFPVFVAAVLNFLFQNGFQSARTAHTILTMRLQLKGGYYYNVNKNENKDQKKPTKAKKGKRR